MDGEKIPRAYRMTCGNCKNEFDIREARRVFTSAISEGGVCSARCYTALYNKPAPLRVYGAWAGNPKGMIEDTECCIAEIYDEDRTCHGRQCSRKRGHGPEGLYCKQHNPEAIKARNAKKEAEWEAAARKRVAERDRTRAALKLIEGIPTEELEKYKLVRKDGE